MRLLENTYNWLIRLFGFAIAMVVFLFFMMLICSSSGCVTVVGNGGNAAVGIAPLSQCVKMCRGANNEECENTCVDRTDKVFIGPVIVIKY